MRCILFAAGALALILSGGCTPYHREPITSNPQMKTVFVDGQNVMVAPYSDGTWGATTSQVLLVVKNPAAERPRLIKAVELVSGCKVVDADYILDRDNLTASVACPRPQ